MNTFQIFITKNNVVEIRDNIYNTIKDKLVKKYNIINNKKISKKIRKKNVDRINKKIINLINELH